MDTWLDDKHNIVLRSDVPVGGRVVMEAMIKVPCSKLGVSHNNMCGFQVGMLPNDG